MLVLPALPALFFLLAMAAAASRCGLRRGFVVATIVYTLGVVGATELLSLAALLRLPQVATFWAVATALAALWLWRSRDPEGLRRRLRRAGHRWAARRGELVAVAVVLAAVLLIAVLSPPNNWESMAYRMMRVVMWQQQGSVAHYATAYPAQLYHPPLVSWHMLHLQLLAGGDRFANVAEWLALVGCAVAASLIARELKQPFRVQVLAAVLAATLPTALLQGSSTHGNVLAAYWLLCAVLMFIQHLRRPAWWRLAGCGAAAGFAVLAKPTMYVFGPPVALALGLYGALACRRPKRTALALAAVLAFAGALNFGHYARNWHLFGHPVLPPGHVDHINERFGLDVLAANLVRNSLLHQGLPWPEFNRAVLAAASKLLGGLPDLPEATHGQPLAAVGITGRIHEKHGANGLHFWLLAASAVGLACLRRRHLAASGANVDLTRWLLAGCLLAVVAFSGTLMWERWNTRYDIALFMLGCPLAATFLAAALRTRPRFRERILRAVAGLFLVACCPWLLLKESAPVVKLPLGYRTLPAETIFAATRTGAYFNYLGGNASHLAYAALADAVADLEPNTVGLHYPYQWEFAYPFYKLLKERLPDVCLTYYDVTGNASASLEPRPSGEGDGPCGQQAGRRGEQAWPDVVVKTRTDRPLRGEGTVYASYETRRLPRGDVAVVLRRSSRPSAPEGR